MIYNDVLEAMGHTPIIRLNKLVGPDDAEVLVKYEGVNIGGSIKTRVAYQMLEAAIKRGDVDPATTIVVEPTSGNQGIGLALCGAVWGIKVRIIMPDSVSAERRKLIKAYGAELVLVHDDGDIGKAIDECLQTAMRMAKEDPNVYVPQQFEDPDNPKAHKFHTALEILEQVGG
ncbi:MAG: pyridoxal-phosphate dependent enzyme, partial [Coriobacteriales bacterium]|nr:pyridoxal-phosphate dependent enzyme [Coriobacteriales bacterium]